MAIGITDTVWSVLRLLVTVILPTPCQSWFPAPTLVPLHYPIFITGWTETV
jgi:hypothetical protein